MLPWSSLRLRTRAKANSLLSAFPVEPKVCGKWPVRQDDTAKERHTETLKDMRMVVGKVDLMYSETGTAGMARERAGCFPKRPDQSCNL